MGEDLDCDIFANVDFGHGMVEVRCTETGEHRVHQCNVILTRSNPQQSNLFEEEVNA